MSCIGSYKVSLEYWNDVEHVSLPESLSIAKTTPDLPSSSLHVWQFGALPAFKLLLSSILIHFSLGCVAVNNNSICS